ncbi:MAG: class I mannose-6-phosphate isomerase [Acidobacteria bacterium]|nr:class I mannose-6-phosphate isomerase [Acidobacteriota bacterium]
MSNPALAPFRLRPFFSPRPWGRRNLAPWYSAQQTGEQAEPIGEAWLTGPQSVAETGACTGKTLAEIAKEYPEELLGAWREEGEFPLLVKLLFPDDKLSVQVHPDDAKAQAIGQKRGKTECWYTLQAEPGASVSCGLKPGITADDLRAAVTSNSMEDLLQQIVLSKGDMVFVDAGTVHAIGPGLTLLETQQTSDTTYRMYDYGRPRELHLEQGIAAMREKTEAGLVTPEVLPSANGTATRLIKQRYFTVDRFDMSQGNQLAITDVAGKPHCIIPIEGSGVLIDSHGTRTELLPGTATVVPASEAAYRIMADKGDDFSFIRSTP